MNLTFNRSGKVGRATFGADRQDKGDDQEVFIVYAIIDLATVSNSARLPKYDPR